MGTPACAHSATWMPLRASIDCGASACHLRATQPRPPPREPPPPRPSLTLSLSLQNLLPAYLLSAEATSAPWADLVNGSSAALT